MLLLLQGRNQEMPCGETPLNEECGRFAGNSKGLGVPAMSSFSRSGIFATCPIAECVNHARKHFVKNLFPPSKRCCGVMKNVKELPKLTAIALVRFYQMAISPLFPPCCRFVPTCSEYALTALRKYGFIKGGKMAVKRILKCRPGGPHGYDPVP